SVEKREWIAFHFARRARYVLDPHGSLPFECDVTREAEQSGGGIKKPSDRGRGKRPHILMNKLQSGRVAGRKRKWRVAQSGQPLHLSQKTRSCLHRILRRGVASGQSGRAQMCNSFKSILQTSDEEFSTPDAAVIAIASAVKADSEHRFLPCAPFGQHRRDVGAVMLHRAFFGRRQPQAMYRRAVLGMSVVANYDVLPANFIHRHQVADRFLERAEGIVMIEIADVLAYKSLPLDHQSHGVL